ncbi:MAG: iron-containing alcohol dehydrogenase [Lachnospiraceae bacterium]|nr:iron-containing alcohol dehydrogenase [Lachnospiraceae bacterium]
MWTGSPALNHLFTFGKGGAWSVHPMEHELSAFYDITHGVGLAILTPAWMRYVLSDETKKRFALFARNVWDVKEENDRAAALAGIELTESFFRKLGMPSCLSEAASMTPCLKRWHPKPCGPADCRKEPMCIFRQPMWSRSTGIVCNAKGPAVPVLFWCFEGRSAGFTEKRLLVQAMLRMVIYDLWDDITLMTDIGTPESGMGSETGEHAFC